ncbi:hypothetical protein M775_10900 [Neisseria gonorrhoeae MU_NG6]|nr:hypothetical protein T556_06595 [Neisseria gonorrhoeae NG-k51.05]KLS77355.1 hypothetical protein M771_11470 [Neisseria gonorrhoeae MU_NG1]KLS90957.1 hypothetical protein M775_10900 [Neisseria gonorrhoeae MU_NG6]KLT01998.1 hypothetical protein M790_05125 [Neisseria gonorrhoeae MU_NG25]
MQQNQSPHYTFREGRLNFPFRTIRQAVLYIKTPK